MRREGRVRGKPTNKSRVTGKCRNGKTRCRSCREFPVENSLPKSRGRYKRFAADVHMNPSLAEFLVKPLKELHQEFPPFDISDDWMAYEDDPRYSRYLDAEDAVQLEILVATVNSMIEAAFARMQSDYVYDWEMEDRTTMAWTRELESEETLADDGELEVFKNAVEATCSQVSRTNRTWSEESWSDVELSSEREQETSVDDDWSMVDDEDL